MGRRSVHAPLSLTTTWSHSDASEQRTRVITDHRLNSLVGIVVASGSPPTHERSGRVTTRRFKEPSPTTASNNKASNNKASNNSKQASKRQQRKAHSCMHYTLTWPARFKRNVNTRSPVVGWSLAIDASDPSLARHVSCGCELVGNVSAIQRWPRPDQCASQKHL